MGLISISNDKKVVWTKFEQIPLENKSFEIFIPETPDSRPTFGKFALTALREPKSTYLFYNHIFFCFKTFIFSWKTEKISNTKKVMVPGSYSKKFFGISAFQWGIDFFDFSKIIFLSGWDFQNGNFREVYSFPPYKMWACRFGRWLGSTHFVGSF